MPTAAKTPAAGSASAAAAAESASVVPGTRNRVTPAARARASSSVRAVSHLQVAVGIGEQRYLTLLPGGHVGGHVEQHGRSRLADRGREDHAVGLDAHELRRLQVRDDDDVAADEGLGLVLRRDARDDLAPLVAEIDLEAHQLVRLGHALGGDDLRRAQTHLLEVLDRDAVVGRAAARRRRGGTSVRSWSSSFSLK